MSDGDMDDMDEELIRVARRAMMKATPTVDIPKIVRALPPVPAHGVRVPVVTRRSRSWSMWQMAAAVSVIAVGGLSIALWPRSIHEGNIPVAAEVSAGDTSHKKAQKQSEEGLGVGGGLSDLDEKDLKAILSSMDSLDDRPSAEPQPAAPGLHRASNELDGGGA